MMNDDPLRHAKYSVRHANRHIKAFDTEAIAYYATMPFIRTVELSASGTEDIHKLKLGKAMPEVMPGIAFDAVNNLRSALDQAAYAVGIAAGTKGKDAHFPFGDTLKTRRYRDIPQGMFDFMRSFKPYKTGNVHLWALNELCNSHKHEIVTPMAMYSASSHLSEAVFSSEGSSFSWPPKWDASKGEMILASIPHGTELEMKASFTACVVIAEVDVVMGIPAIQFLRHVSAEVERIILGIEAEGKRVKVFQ
jgi:hypothetical protein